MGPKLRLSRR
ncbi:unnamed protein product, partial [Didymodactylos carnosus]